MKPQYLPKAAFFSTSSRFLFLQNGVQWRFGTSYRIYECGDHYHLTTKPQRGIPAVRGDR